MHSNNPVTVNGMSNTAATAGGGDEMLAVKSDGTAWAWGLNSYGQLGNLTNTPSNVPVQVSGLTGVVAVSGGLVHGLALKSDGTVWGWGYNGNGGLGNGSGVATNFPVQATGLAGAVAIAAGSHHSYALKSDGTVWAWGNNQFGQLGVANVYNYTPFQMAGLFNIVAITAGEWHFAALRSDGTVWTIGYNDHSQLGNVSTLTSNVPTQVPGLAGVVAIAAGGLASHTLALKADGTVVAWGFNSNGQLGNGTNSDSIVPVPVSGLTNVVAVATGARHGMALRNDGRVWTWGNNSYGQLGNCTFNDTNVPVAVRGLGGVTAIAGGYHNSLAIGNAPSPNACTVDNTPPAIVPAVTGTLGANGWYTGPVTVTWSVTDPDSAIGSSNGCGPVTLVANTPGTTLTCSATNGDGLTSTVPLTVKIDLTRPVIVPTITGPTGANGWYTGNVVVSWATTDPESGISSSTGCTTQPATTSTILTCTATNGAGLSTSVPVTIKIDPTAPVITPTLTGTLGANGWYTSNVTVSWTMTDPESGIATSTGCASQTLTAGTTLTCAATNGAGLSTATPVMVKIDKSGPTIAGMPGAACSLWPPNHKLVQVATVSASDVGAGIAPGTFTVSGTSNEPASPGELDVIITANGSGGFVVQLRAERLGTGTGRTYTLTATAKDLAGNTVTLTSSCRVPHDQGQ